MMPWRGLGEKQPQSIPELHYKDYANNYPIYLILNLYPLDHSSQGRAHTHPIHPPYHPIAREHRYSYFNRLKSTI